MDLWNYCKLLYSLLLLEVSNYGNVSHIYFFWQKSSVELITIGSWRPSGGVRVQFFSCTGTLYCVLIARTQGTNLGKSGPTARGAGSCPCVATGTADQRRRSAQSARAAGARTLNRDMSVSRTSWHKGVILGRNSVFGVFHL